jgi:hypothetical protein
MMIGNERGRNSPVCALIDARRGRPAVKIIMSYIRGFAMDPKRYNGATSYACGACGASGYE